jgi:hypothetical protein
MGRAERSIEASGWQRSERCGKGGSEETVESEAEEEEEEESRDEAKGSIQSTRWRDCLSECVESRERREEKGKRKREADHAGTFREQGESISQD